MSATNVTPNIGLPSFVGTDKPAWLTDWNGAMNTIDTEVGSAKTDIQGQATQISGLSASVTSIGGTVSQHTTSIQTLTTETTHNTGDISTINSLIGNGTPTTTDHTIIGAINELHADQGDLANLTTTDKSSIVAAVNEVAQGGGTPSAQNVTYDNTSSGLTANNVQAAIDELAAGSVIDFDLSAHTGDASLTMDSAATLINGGLRYAFNSDYSVGKIYGAILCTGDIATYNDWHTVCSFQLAGLARSAVLNMETGNVGLLFSSGGAEFKAVTFVRLKVDTDGTVELQLKNPSTGASATTVFCVSIPACIYFLKDFGD